MKTIFDFLQEKKQKYEKDYDLDDFIPEYIGDLNLINDILIPDNKYYVVGFVDCDSDGISAFIILQDVFKSCNVEHYIHISDRKEGYGLNNNRLDILVQTFHNKKWELGVSDYKLVLFTADLGITNKTQVEHAYEIGFDKVIITDHHTVEESTLPKADLIINMKLQKNEKLWVCGAGLVYMLYRNYCNQVSELFAGSATIGDMVGLEFGSVNRTLAKRSIEILKKENIQDLKLFYFLNKAIFKFGQNPITETTFSFGIVPMINSLSRMGKQELIRSYFSKEDGMDKVYLEEMYDANVNRKAIQAKFEEQAVELLKQYSEAELNEMKSQISIFIMPHHITTICGLVSSFILNEYGLDNIVLAKTDDDNIWKGSGRSKKFAIYDFLKELKLRYEINGGGHRNALGLSIKKQELIKLENDYKNGVLNEIELIQCENIDDSIYNITYSEMNDESILKMIEYFSPYGMESKPPKLEITNLQIINIKKSGSHLFLDCEIKSDENEFETPILRVCVFKEYDQSMYKVKKYFDVIGQLSGVNEIIADKIIWRDV